MSHDPVKMPEMAAGALMFIRGDLDRAKTTIERSYTQKEVWDSKKLPRQRLIGLTFTPGFPMSKPLLHGSRIQSLYGDPAVPITADLAGPFESDTGQLGWHTNLLDRGTGDD